jgi:hypothetical protein
MQSAEHSLSCIVSNDTAEGFFVADTFDEHSKSNFGKMKLISRADGYQNVVDTITDASRLKAIGEETRTCNSGSANSRSPDCDGARSANLDTAPPARLYSVRAAPRGKSPHCTAAASCTVLTTCRLPPRRPPSK